MKERLVIASVLGGVAILAAVVFAVFQFGRVDPSPPSLEENPNPAIPGEILYFDDAGCAVRARASGEGRTVRCSEDLRHPGVFAWVAPDVLAVWEMNQLVEINLETYERTIRTDITADQQRITERPGFSVNGETVMAEGGDLIVIGPDGERDEIASFDVGSRWIQPVLWSPDGNWIVVQWHPPRENHAELWIISRDGETRGTIVDDDTGFPWSVAWWIDGVGGSPTFDDIVGDPGNPVDRDGGQAVPVR